MAAILKYLHFMLILCNNIDRYDTMLGIQKSVTHETQ